MSDIVKWKPAHLTTQEKITEALELARKPTYQQPSQPRPGYGSNLPKIERSKYAVTVSVPRFCSIYKNPYAAYYVLNESDGVYRHTECGKITHAGQAELVARMRDADSLFALNYADMEKCPWCGVSGSGPLYCFRCQTFICWGTTNSTNWCICGFCGQRCHVDAGAPPQPGILI